jgi:hypothetical protein
VDVILNDQLLKINEKLKQAGMDGINVITREEYDES